tara:strand:+ start:6288 stop:6674 length:387 start_codon:yes stop_codon:yes gene_type:complete
MTQYVLLDANKVILNKVMYDPSSDWKPPSGETIGEIPDSISFDVGGKWDGTNYTAPVVEEMPDDLKKKVNAKLAKEQLKESDWAGLADVREKLSNLSAWDTYRASLRDFIINPKPDELPSEPKVVWKE